MNRLYNKVYGPKLRQVPARITLRAAVCDCCLRDPTVLAYRSFPGIDLERHAVLDGQAHYGGATEPLPGGV